MSATRANRARDPKTNSLPTQHRANDTTMKRAKVARAEPISKNPKVREIEKPHRAFMHLLKVYRENGRAEAVPLLDRLATSEFIDPSGSSLSAVDIIHTYIDPKIDLGQKYSRSQSKKASAPRRGRGLENALEHLVRTQDEDMESGELWNAFLGSSFGLTIKETKSNRELEWTDDATGETGKLSYSSFKTMVSEVRRRVGKQKQPRTKD